MDINTKNDLKHFYLRSVNYKESLMKHDDAYFEKYIDLIKQISNRDFFLDVGCGIGYSTKKISELSNIKFAVGLDISELFIQNEYENSNTKFVVGDIHDITTKAKLLILSPRLQKIPQQKNSPGRKKKESRTSSNSNKYQEGNKL